MKPEKAARYAGLLVWLPAVLCGWPWSASARSEESLKERHARIEGMDPTEKEELRWQLKRFSGLEQAEQERLRQLHERIVQDPRKDDLRKVMERYCQWVKTLPSYERAELRGLPPAERIERIIELRQEEESQRKDREGVIAWLDDYLDRGAPEFMNALPKDRQEDVRRELEEAKDDPEQRRRIFARTWFERFARTWFERRKDGPRRPLTLDDSTLDELRGRLSDATRKRLEDMPKENQRGFLMFRLSWALVSSAPRFTEEPPTEASQEQLAEYLKKHVPPGQREWLLSLPPEQQRRWLSRLYSRSQASGKPRHFPGRGPGPRGPSGPPFRKPGAGPPGPKPGPPPPQPPGEKPPADVPPPPERQN